MFLSSLNLGFDTGASLTPLVHQLAGFLFSTLFLQLSVLVLPPNSLQLLLKQLISWVVVEITGTTFKSVLLLELNLLWWMFRHINGIESIEVLFLKGLFGLCKWIRS
jgi:hypothetical protein